MTDETPDQPTLDDHPGLDNDEATDEGKMMTAEGSDGRTDDTEEAPTLEEHPGLDKDEATDEGKMMTAEGSIGAKRESTGTTSRKDDPA